MLRIRASERAALDVNLLLDLAPALLIAWLAVPPLARTAGRLGLIDVPKDRSTHATPVPRIGGIAIALGLVGAIGILALRGHAALDAGGTWVPYLVPAVLYFAIGLADDRRGLAPGMKFILQGSAAACAVALGLRWDGSPVGPFVAIEFGGLTPVLTWLWFVAVVVLVNFVDGIDLITASVAVIVLGAAAGGGAGPGDGMLYLLAAAAVVGFGYWNLRPARAFPGDAATHLLGFLIATAAMRLPGETTALPWAVASAPLLPGVIDVALGLAAKLRHGVPLWRAHSQHLYQRLTRVGWSHAGVALRYGVLAAAALLMVTVIGPRWGLWACLGLSAPILLWHVGLGLWRTRTIPYRF